MNPAYFRASEYLVDTISSANRIYSMTFSHWDQRKNVKTDRLPQHWSWKMGNGNSFLVKNEIAM